MGSLSLVHDRERPARSPSTGGVNLALNNCNNRVKLVLKAPTVDYTFARNLERRTLPLAARDVSRSNTTRTASASNPGSSALEVISMPKASSALNQALPPSYDHWEGGNADRLQLCIRDAQRAACRSDAPAVERHLHRIVASAGLESLQHLKSHQHGPAQRAERLVNDALQQLARMRIAAAP